MNLEDTVTELRVFVRNYITEFDSTCSSFLSNISQISRLYSKSKQQLDSLAAEAADGNFALCNVDALSQIADDFDKITTCSCSHSLCSQAECLRLLVHAHKSSAELPTEPQAWPEECFLNANLQETRAAIDAAARGLESLLE